ncbi:MAG: hypothetical protein V3V75_02380 [Thermoguttaceae bacterium]
MPSISKCPKCGQEVTVPERLGPEAEVRCPLCDAEYPWSEALAEAPPELIPVPPADVPTTVEPVEEEAEPIITVLIPESDDTPPADAPEIDTPEIDTGQAPVDASALAAFGSDNAAEQQQEAISHETVSAGVASATPQPKRKQKAAGRQMIEAILGGFAGLLLGYYLLCWFGPERLDLPKLPLPFLPPSMNQEAGDDANVADPDGPQLPADEKKQDPRPEQQPQEQPEGPEPKKPEPKEPEPKEPEPEEPEPLPIDYVGPRDVPDFSSADLGKALRDANEAMNSELSDGQITAHIYGLLCKAGHVVAFAKNKTNDPQHVHRQQAAENMLRKLGQDANRLTQIWDHSAALLKTEGGPEGGIVLAGKVGQVALSDGLHGAVINPTTSPGAVVVLSDQPLSFVAEDEILIFGSLIKDPAKNIVGYSGSKPFIIWAGTSVKLDR